MGVTYLTVGQVAYQQCLSRLIPVVVSPTAQAEEGIYRSYDLDARSFVTKSVIFGTLVEAMRGLGRCCLDVVQAPGRLEPL